MAQIRWDNIAAPDLRGASSILGQAGQSFSRGIDNLEQIVQGGLGREKKAITDASTKFLSTVREQYQTPEALQAAQQSGALDQLRGQFGQLDAGMTDANAIDGLVSAGRDRAVADDQYTKSRLYRDTAQQRNDFARMISTGDVAGARKLLDTDNLGDLETELYGTARSTEKAQQAEERTLLDRSRQAQDRARTLALAEKREVRDQTAYDRSQKQIENTEKLDSLLGDSLLNQYSEEDQYEKQVSDVTNQLRQLGVTAVQASDPAYMAKQSPEMVKQIQDISANLPARLPGAKARKNAFAQEAAALGIPASMAISGANAFDSFGVKANANSAVEAEQQAAQMSALENNPLVKNSTLVQMAKNPVPVAETTATILANNAELIDGIGWIDTGNVREFLSKAATTGVSIDNGKDPVKFSPAMLDQVLKASLSYGTGGWREAEPMVVAQEMMKKGVFDDEIEGLNLYQQGARDIKGLFNKSKGSTSSAVSRLLGNTDYDGILAQQRVDAAEEEAAAAAQAKKDAVSTYRDKMKQTIGR